MNTNYGAINYSIAGKNAIWIESAKEMSRPWSHAICPPRAAYMPEAILKSGELLGLNTKGVQDLSPYIHHLFLILIYKYNYYFNEKIEQLFKNNMKL